ncbi:MAG TPA: GAF domain-containing sensor histidine kinase [Thermoanaerobaculia bacterium]|nr:GAF domain-containing sensor histidine kinase [Thermoanaerobaculia bacterium]
MIQAQYFALMTLKRLKAIAILIPIAGVIALELARIAVLGVISWQNRVALDLLYVAAIIVFAIFIFRYVDQMQERLRRQNVELLALHTATLDVTAELSLEVVLKRVVEQARSLVGAKYGAVSVVDKDNRIVSFITSGITNEEREKIGPPPVGHGLLGVVLHHGHTLRLEELQRHPQSHGFPAHHPPMHSLLAVPIPCKGPFLGNLYLTEKQQTGVFTPDDEETLNRFALQAALAIDNAHLHEQVADLAVAQERVRIAHEMHDGLAQVLGYVNTKVQAAEMYMKRDKSEEAKAQLRELAGAARQAYSDVRESIVGLRALPGPKRSLAGVLEEYLARWEEMSGVAATLNIDPGVQLTPSQELQLVRVVQESLTNVRKHARASHARVDIRRDGDRLVALITDDGSGFNAAARARGEFPQFGLSTMRERAESIGGSLSIDSAPGAGTTVRVELPYTLAS